LPVSRPTPNTFKEAPRRCRPAGAAAGRFEEQADAKLLATIADHKVHNIIHLICRAKSYEGHCKVCEFSRLSMEERWRAGYHSARRTLRHCEVLNWPNDHAGVFTFDLAADGRE
jgi:NTE family protein